MSKQRDTLKQLAYEYLNGAKNYDFSYMLGIEHSYEILFGVSSEQFYKDMYTLTNNELFKDMQTMASIEKSV